MNRILGILALLACISGCSSSTPTGPAGDNPESDVLREVGELIAAHAPAGRGKAPSTAQLDQYDPTFPRAVKAVRSGEIVVIWGGKPADEEAVAKGEAGKGIMAYEKKTPTEGGLVLLQNGEVKTLTAEEFKSAPKADGK